MQVRERSMRRPGLKRLKSMASTELRLRLRFLPQVENFSLNVRSKLKLFRTIVEATELENDRVDIGDT